MQLFNACKPAVNFHFRAIQGQNLCSLGGGLTVVGTVESGVLLTEIIRCMPRPGEARRGLKQNMGNGEVITAVLFADRTPKRRENRLKAAQNGPKGPNSAWPQAIFPARKRNHDMKENEQWAIVTDTKPSKKASSFSRSFAAECCKCASSVAYIGESDNDPDVPVVVCEGCVCGDSSAKVGYNHWSTDNRPIAPAPKTTLKTLLVRSFSPQECTLPDETTSVLFSIAANDRKKRQKRVFQIVAVYVFETFSLPDQTFCGLLSVNREWKISCKARGAVDIYFAASRSIDYDFVIVSSLVISIFTLS